MKEKYDFATFVAKLNAKEILSLSFSLPGSGHYRRCRIYWQKQDYPLLGKTVYGEIVVELGPKERCYFPKSLNPDLIVFRLGPKGKLTLRDVYDKIEITELVETEGQ